MSNSSDIKGNKIYILREGDHRVPYSLELTICSSATANDGFFPYGTTFDSVDSFEILDSEGTTVSGVLEGTAAITDCLLEFDLSYPTEGAGDYTILTTINFTMGAVERKKTIRDKKIRAY